MSRSPNSKRTLKGLLPAIRGDYREAGNSKYGPVSKLSKDMDGLLPAYAITADLTKGKIVLGPLTQSHK